MIAARARVARLPESWKGAGAASAFFCRAGNRGAESQRPIWSVDRQFQIRLGLLQRCAWYPLSPASDTAFDPKIVVGMQHRPTTSFGKMKTPKKAAVACLFSFPQRMPHRRLVSRKLVAVDCRCAWGLRIRTDLTTMGIVMKKMVLIA